MGHLTWLRFESTYTFVVNHSMCYQLACGIRSDPQYAGSLLFGNVAFVSCSWQLKLLNTNFLYESCTNPVTMYQLCPKTINLHNLAVWFQFNYHTYHPEVFQKFLLFFVMFSSTFLVKLPLLHINSPNFTVTYYTIILINLYWNTSFYSKIFNF